MKVTVERVRIAEVAGSRASRGRAAQHHSDPRQRAAFAPIAQAQPEGDRPRCRSDRDDRRRGRSGRFDHGSGAHVLRHRPQAAGRLAGRAGIVRRPRRARDPRRPLALHAANPAGKRFSRSRARRDDAQIHAQGRRAQAADRQDPVRHLDRGDPLLPQRHLSARRRQPAKAHTLRAVATDGHRLAQMELDAADGRRRHAGHHRAAQDRRRGAAADRRQRGRGCRSSCRRARSASRSATWC